MYAPMVSAGTTTRGSASNAILREWREGDLGESLTSCRYSSGSTGLTTVLQDTSVMTTLQIPPAFSASCSVAPIGERVVHY